MKTMIKFHRVGRNHNPGGIEVNHETPIPARADLEEAVRAHCDPFIRSSGYDVDIVFESSPDTDHVGVNVALDGGRYGYGAGAVVPDLEPPC